MRARGIRMRMHVRTLKYLGKYRHWRMVTFAGALGFAIALAGVEVIDAYSRVADRRCRLLWRPLPAVFGMCLAGALSAWRIRQKLSEQNMRLDAALNNMIQGLCMFDAQNRLLVWNERYRTMYNIDPKPFGAAAASATCSTRASRRERSRSIRNAMKPSCARRSSKARPSRSISN